MPTSQKMDMQPAISRSEYEVRCQPFNHFLLMQLQGAISMFKIQEFSKVLQKSVSKELRKQIAPAQKKHIYPMNLRGYLFLFLLLLSIQNPVIPEMMTDDGIAMLMLCLSQGPFSKRQKSLPMKVQSFLAIISNPVRMLSDILLYNN